MRRILDWLTQRSFRLKLIGAAVAAEILLVAVLAHLGMRQMDEALSDQLRVRIEQSNVLFNAALGPELAERNHSALELVLEHARSESEVEYAVLRDGQGRLLVAKGWDTRQPLPPVDRDLRRADEAGLVNIQQFITLGGQRVGELRYGLSTAFFRQARQNLIRQALLVASAAILISLAGLAMLGFGMMSRLGALAGAARRLADGDLNVRVANDRHDEIGRLATAFNDMARTLDERMRELHASEERLALVMRGTSDGIWDWDVRRNISYFSPRFRELLGYEDEQAFGLLFQFRTALHPDDRDRVIAALDNALLLPIRFDETYRLRCRDGTFRWFRGRGYAERDEDGSTLRFAGSLSDLSAQKAAEEALRESEERLFHAVRGSSDGIWDWNIALDRYYISPRYRELLGYTEEEMPNARSSFLDIVHPEDRPRVEEAVRRHFKERTPYDIEYRMRHKDGSYRWFRGRGQAVWDADGRATRFSGSSSDIMAQKAAADSIRSLLAEQQALLDNALVGIVYLKNRVIERCNRRFEELFGYNEGGMLGQTTALVYATPEIFAETGRKAYAALGRGETYSEELQLRHKDGRFFWGSLTGRAIDAAHPQSGSVWIYLDITERRLAMEALQEEKDLSDALLAGLPGISALFDQNMHLLRWNRNLEAASGYTPEELATMKATDLYNDGEAVEKASSIALARGIVTHGEAKLKTSDGRLIPYYLYAAPILRGERKLLVGMGFDISGRKQAEAALRESEERFRKFFEESADASLIIEGDRFVDCNQAALNMLRLHSKDALGTVHPSELSPEWQPDGRSSVEKANEMIGIAFSRGSHRFEWLHRRADGEVFPAEVLLTRIVHLGKPLLYVVWRDITDRKLAETEIRKLNDELEQRVRERTAELTAANKELEAFSYSVSHDLVAPLRAIDGFSRMIEEDYGPVVDTRGKGYIERIRSGTQRMQQIIDDMLALARVTRNEMRRETVSLSGIAGQILCDLKQMQPHRIVAMHIALDICVSGDPNLLRIAMENLLRNAWKFTAQRATAAIEFGVLRDGGKQVYFVRDDGAGFDMQYAGKLFSPFQRMHRPQEFEGTGIGLAIVQRVIQRHGGRIWAEAAPERGATFYFTLS